MKFELKNQNINIEHSKKLLILSNFNFSKKVLIKNSVPFKIRSFKVSQ